MDQNFQTSFIPKKPIIEERTSFSEPVGIFFIASLIILFIVLLGTGGVYFYKLVVTKNFDSLQASLQLAQNSFEPTELNQLQTLDKRLKASTEILDNHISITPVFDALQQVTMHTVRFTKFSYDLGADSSANVDIKLSGVAIGYRSVALQSDLLSANKNFINPVFSNLTLDNSGNVVFDLEFFVPASFVNYKQSLLTQAESTN
jgi:hypothetical protein